MTLEGSIEIKATAASVYARISGCSLRCENIGQITFYMRYSGVDEKL